MPSFLNTKLYLSMARALSLRGRIYASRSSGSVMDALIEIVFCKFLIGFNERIDYQANSFGHIYVCK